MKTMFPVSVCFLSKTISVTGRGGNRLTDGGEVVSLTRRPPAL
jgi:hypothetical protein